MELPYKDIEQKRKAQRDYHARNKEKINARHRKKYGENLEAGRLRCRDYYSENREEESKRKKIFRQKVKSLFPDKCVSCGSKQGLLLHEIHWKKHPISLSYYAKHKEDFIPLCHTCHKGFHFLHQICKMELEEILAFVKQKLKVVQFT